MCPEQITDQNSIAEELGILRNSNNSYIEPDDVEDHDEHFDYDAFIDKLLKDDASYCE